MWRQPGLKIWLMAFIVVLFWEHLSLVPVMPLLFDHRLMESGIPTGFFVCANLLIVALIPTLILDKYRRYSAFGIWALRSFIFFFNPFMTSPDTGVSGFLLVLLIFSDLLEDDSKLRPILGYAILIWLSHMYFTAGIKKMVDPDWFNGVALYKLMRVYVTNPEFAKWIRSGPAGILALQLSTWFAIIQYMTFWAVLIDYRLFWLTNIGMLAVHIIFIPIFDLHQVSIVMVVAHSLPLLLLRGHKFNLLTMWQEIREFAKPALADRSVKGLF